MEDLTKLREVKILTILGMKDRGIDESVKCPFHRDGTPSLRIYKNNSYHCFGCAVNGQNAIDFLMESGEDFTKVINELKEFI